MLQILKERGAVYEDSELCMVHLALRWLLYLSRQRKGLSDQPDLPAVWRKPGRLRSSRRRDARGNFWDPRSPREPMAKMSGLEAERGRT